MFVVCFKNDPTYKKVWEKLEIIRNEPHHYNKEEINFPLTGLLF